MRNRLIYILKHVKFIQKFYVCVMSFVFRIWGKFLKTDDELVIFVSFMGKGFNDSPKAIYDYLITHSECQKYKCVWAFENPQNFNGLNSVKIDTLKYFKTALKAKYWITNTNIERGLKFKKKNQIYLNTWHGIPLKYIGNDCPGRNDYNFDTVDFLAVSGDYDECVFKSAFNAREENYLRCGMPRNEELWFSNDYLKTKFRKKLGIPADKKVILYAPTWRESKDKGKSYSIDLPVSFDRWREILTDEYVVLLRTHHQTDTALGIEYNDFVIDVSKYPFVNDLMIASDLLITDYSAIAFDYSILCRPILVYAYDYEEYLLERGTYFDIDDKYPNKSCRSETELIDRIINLDYKAECQNTKKFRDEFIKYGINSTEICVKKVFL